MELEYTVDQFFSVDIWMDKNKAHHKWMWSKKQSNLFEEYETVIYDDSFRTGLIYMRWNKDLCIPKMVE